MDPSLKLKIKEEIFQLTALLELFSHNKSTKFPFFNFLDNFLHVILSILQESNAEPQDDTIIVWSV